MNSLTMNVFKLGRSVVLFSAFGPMLTGCGENEELPGKPYSGIKTVYIETQNFGRDVKTCFDNILLNKYLDTTFNAFERPNSPGLILHFPDFKSYSSADQLNNIERVKIVLKSNSSNRPATYSIERFHLQGKQWKQIGVYDYTVRDRAEDFISPGQSDVDEICEQLIRTTIEIYYLFKDNVSMNQFENFRQKRKFVEEEGLFYPGIADESMRDVLTQKVNLAANDFAKVFHQTDATDADYLQMILMALKRFESHNLDTEDRERVCHYFEELMNMVGLESSGGLLNEFMYGFDPNAFKKE